METKPLESEDIKRLEKEYEEYKNIVYSNSTLEDLAPEMYAER